MNWYTRSKLDDRQGLVIDEDTDANIAVTYDPKHAALVAAAPDLLNACEQILDEYSRALYPVDRRTLRDAIAKAGGAG